MNIQVEYNEITKKVTIRNLVGTNTIEFDRVENLEELISVIEDFLKLGED